jgi:hypothetical protein
MGSSECCGRKKTLVLPEGKILRFMELSNSSPRGNGAACQHETAVTQHMFRKDLETNPDTSSCSGHPIKQGG